jgi:hypothetical protein
MPRQNNPQVSGYDRKLLGQDWVSSYGPKPRYTHACIMSVYVICLCVCVCVYINTFPQIHMYIHLYVHTCHTCICIYLHTHSMRAYLHTYLHCTHEFPGQDSVSSYGPKPRYMYACMCVCIYYIHTQHACIRTRPHMSPQYLAYMNMYLHTYYILLK